MESLIDLIAAKNSTTAAPGIASPTQIVTPESITTTEPAPERSNLLPPPKWAESPDFKYYDPVEAGVIEEQYAKRLVEEFKTAFVESFPFVVVDGDFSALRRDQPFLFHSILTVTSYASPAIQYLLSEELRRQLARVIEHARKSLEILQGLLVYGAWYHAFYHPASQQLAIVVQLCVALIQDLGLSRSGKLKPGVSSVTGCAVQGRPKGTLPEKRALLGTFFLTVLYVSLKMEERVDR